MATARAKNTGLSVQRVRPILKLVRGKPVEDALRLLMFMTTPAAAQLAKTVKSAASNAESQMLARMGDLKITEAYADEGPRIKRFRARARGRVSRITRRSSHITVVVDQEAR